MKITGLFRRKSTKSTGSSVVSSKLRKEAPPNPAPLPPPLQQQQPPHAPLLPPPQTPRNGSSDASPSNGHSTPLSTFSSFGATDPQNSRSTVTLPSSVDEQDYAVGGGGGKANVNGNGGMGGVDVLREESTAGRAMLVEDDDTRTTASSLYRTKSAPQQQRLKQHQHTQYQAGSESTAIPNGSADGGSGGGRHSRRHSTASQGTAERADFRQSDTTITKQRDGGQDQNRTTTPRKQPQHQNQNLNQNQMMVPQQQHQQQIQGQQHQLVPHTNNGSGNNNVNNNGGAANNNNTNNGSSSNLPSEWRDREPSVFSRFTHSPTPSESASMQYAHSITSNTTTPRPNHHNYHNHYNNTPNYCNQHKGPPYPPYPNNDSSSSLINNNNNSSSPINNIPNNNNGTPTSPGVLNNKNNHPFPPRNNNNNNHPPTSDNPNNQNTLLPPFGRQHLHPNDQRTSRHPHGPRHPHQQHHPRSPNNIPPIPPLPPGVRSNSFRNYPHPHPRQLPVLPENGLVHNRATRPPPRPRNLYPPSAMPPMMMNNINNSINNNRQPVSRNNSPPRNKNVPPTPGPQSMIIHFTPSQLNCMLKHSDLKRMGNFHHSMPCMTCRRMVVDGMFYCSWCSLRICKSCSTKLHKEWDGDITKGWGVVEVLNTDDNGEQLYTSAEPRRPATAHGATEYVVRWGVNSRPGTSDTVNTTASLPMSQTIMKVNHFFNASSRPGSSGIRPSTGASKPSPLNQLQTNSLAQPKPQQQQQQQQNLGIDISFDGPEQSNATTPELVHPVPTHYKVNTLLEPAQSGSVSPPSANSSQQSPVSPLEPSINISNGTLDSSRSNGNGHSRVASNPTVSSIGTMQQEKHTDIITEMAMEPKIKRKGLKGMFARR